MKQVRELKRGEFFTRKDIPFPRENQVLIRGEYDRTLKKYVCQHWNDANYYVCLKPDTIVYTDFTF